jgi:hypothetical protein
MMLVDGMQIHNSGNLPRSPIGSLFQRAFNCAPSTNRAVLQKGFEEPKQRRQPLVFDQESKADILGCTQQDSGKYTPVTRTEIHHHCSAKFNKEMTKSWVDSFIG